MCCLSEVAYFKKHFNTKKLHDHMDDWQHLNCSGSHHLIYSIFFSQNTSDHCWQVRSKNPNWSSEENVSAHIFVIIYYFNGINVLFESVECRLCRLHSKEVILKIMFDWADNKIIFPIIHFWELFTEQQTLNRLIFIILGFEINAIHKDEFNIRLTFIE